MLFDVNAHINANPGNQGFPDVGMRCSRLPRTCQIAIIKQGTSDYEFVLLSVQNIQVLDIGSNSLQSKYYSELTIFQISSTIVFFIFFL